MRRRSLKKEKEEEKGGTRGGKSQTHISGRRVGTEVGSRGSSFGRAACHRGANEEAKPNESTHSRNLAASICPRLSVTTSSSLFKAKPHVSPFSALESQTKRSRKQNKTTPRNVKQPMAVDTKIVFRSKPRVTPAVLLAVVLLGSV
ncbi:hypothetical protein EYF80_013866 [Liparis tanakae]|uniref:Uncharacterized protein n=1 Tax=Liparis tanakae TaxID=230148 RepID=A0A4Z2ID71_9TELE|nr:hypothetical protein EYF80_013866 [Liparis tanakae]